MLLAHVYLMLSLLCIVRNKEARKLVKQTPEQRALDDVWCLMGEAKRRNRLDEAGLAKCMGMGVSTLGTRKDDPGSISVKELLILLKLSGKRMMFVEVI